MKRRPLYPIPECSGSCGENCTAHAMLYTRQTFPVCWHRDCPREAEYEVDVLANGVKVATRLACADHRRAVREAPLVMSSIERKIQ